MKSLRLERVASTFLAIDERQNSRDRRSRTLHCFCGSQGRTAGRDDVFDYDDAITFTHRSFDQSAGAWQPTEMETLALERYRELLALHAWRDAIPLHIRAPLPAYAGIIDAQRVYMVSALQLAARGKGEAVRDALNADLAYWRGAHRNAQNLIAKMIAAIRVNGLERVMCPSPP